MIKGGVSIRDTFVRNLFSQRDQWVSVVQKITQSSISTAERSVDFFIDGLKHHTEYLLEDADIWRLFYESVRMAQLINKGEIRKDGPDLYLIEPVTIDEITTHMGLERKTGLGAAPLYFTRKHKLSFEDIMLPEE